PRPGGRPACRAPAPAARPSRRPRRPRRGSPTGAAAPRRRRPATGCTDPNKPPRPPPRRARRPERSVPPGSSTPPSTGSHRPRTRPSRTSTFTEPALPLTACDGPGLSRRDHAEPVQETEEQVFGHLVGRGGLGGQHLQQVLGGGGAARLGGPVGGPVGGVARFEEVVLQREPVRAAVPGSVPAAPGAEVAGHRGAPEAGRPRPVLRGGRLHHHAVAVHHVPEQGGRAGLPG